MAGFGLAAGAGFARGFGEAFNNSFHQSQELALRKQQMQMQQQREMMAKADDDRAKLAATIQSHAEQLLAQGGTPEQVLHALRGPIQALERFTRSSGHSTDTIAPWLGSIVARGTGEAQYDAILNGGGQRTTQAQQVPARDTAFDQAPQSFSSGMPQGPSPGMAAPVPFMQGQVGGASQPAAGPDMPPPPANVDISTLQQGQGGQQQFVQQKIDRLLRAENLAHTNKDQARVEYFRDQRRKLMRDNAGEHVDLKQAPDGSWLFIHKDTGQIMDEDGHVYHTPKGGDLASAFEQTTTDGFLSALPGGAYGQDAQTIKGLADYTIDPKSLASRQLKGGGSTRRETYLALASRYAQLRGESYDQKQYSSRSTAVTRFASGKQGDTTKSFNVLVDHLEVLDQTITALENGDTAALNRLKNIWQTEFGTNSAPNTFQGVKTVVSDELVKAVLGIGTGALGDREAVQKTIDAANSPKILRDQVRAYKSLAAGQLRGLRKEYESSTGLKDFDDKLFPHTIEVITGANKEEPSAGGEWQTDPETGQRWREVR
jgi:hypothetical protein